MRLTQNIFLGYCVVFSVLLILSVAAASKTLTDLLLPLFFLPIAAYFFIEIALKIKQAKVRSDTSRHTQKPFVIMSKEFLGTLILFVLLLGSSLFRILYGSTTSGSLITPLGANPTTTPAATESSSLAPSDRFFPPIIRIKAQDEKTFVNIHQEASSTARIIFKAKNGEIFPVNNEQGDWYEIILDNQSKGFVNSQFVIAETNAIQIKTK